MNVQHHIGTRGEFYLENNGQKIGELTYNMISERHMIINSTYVHPSFREHGKGHELLQAAADYARKNSIKIETTCSFVRRAFSENDLFNDVKMF